MIFLGILDACNGRFAWEILPIILGAAILGWVLKHFMGSGKINEYKGTISDWERKHSLLAAENEKTTAKFSASMGQHERTITDFRSTIAGLEKNVETLQQEKTFLGNKLNQSESEFSSLKQKLIGAEATVKNLTAEKEALNNDWNSKYNALKVEMGNAKELEAKLASREEELSKLKKQLSDREAQKLELDLRIKSLSEMAGKLPTLEAEIGSYKKKLADADISYSSKLSAIETKSNSSISEYETKISALQSSINNLKAQADKLPGLENDLKSWKEKLAGLEANNKQLADEAVALQDKWTAEKNLMLGASNTELNSLKTHLDERNRKIAELEQKLSASTASLGSLQTLQSELATQKDLYNKLQLDSAQHLSTVKSLEDRLKAAEAKNTNMAAVEADLQSFRVKNSELQKEIGEWKTKWSQSESKMSLIPATLLMSKAKKDDLKIVEGIGPKIEELLNDEGILYFEQLADASYVRIRKALDKGGEKFRMHDPGTWGEQADLAAQGKWDELKKLQEQLDGGRRVIHITEPPKPIKRDDLKLIEGIGPKIEELLNNAGIFSFEQLAHVKADNLKKILEEAGSRFQMHDPTTWPQQSELAAKGSWEELKKLQSKLIAGKK